MSGRIEVNGALPAAAMPARILNAMREHAREAHPEECCGLLVGRAPGWFEDVHRCHNDMTLLHQRDPDRHPRDGRRAFHMRETDYLAVEKEAAARGWKVTAVYHSHADEGAYFSALDRDHALHPGFPFPDAQHVVLSVVEGVVKDAAVFRRIPETPGFEGRRLVAEAP